ncbi:hypothetical protein [Kozakia baliensis]|uniref:hypothetical protein n=1 Tax=Kozakia baliensis TaxID=153496 RepID=UPI000497A26D|nr:hypothetical protein [Kozakia baliensis]
MSTTLLSLRSKNISRNTHDADYFYRAEKTHSGAFRELAGETGKDIKRVWVTKGHLHSKIVSVEGKPRKDGWFTPRSSKQALRFGKDCFFTMEEAKIHADAKRAQQVKILERKISQIQTLIESEE